MKAAASVITSLASGRKASQLYPPTHPAFIEAIDALVTAVSAATASGPITLNLHQGHLYHASSVIPDDNPGCAAIAEALESRKVESLTLQAHFSRTDATGLVEVLGLRPSPELDVEAELQRRGVTAVTVSFLLDEEREEREERDRKREQDRALYNRLVAVLKAMSAQIAQSGRPDTAAAGEMVDNIMQRMLEDQASVLGLATMRGMNEAHLFHSINVMIYSMTLGSALGLPEEGLTSLGLAALMHDIGKAAFKTDDPAQAEPMRRMHPQIGAELLARHSDEDPSPMLVAYEHHMHVDGGGFPEHPGDYVGHPFSRMVAIADRYTNLTTETAEREAMTPDKAILQVLRESGTALDPMFARLFAKAMGVFPVGCLVRLSDQSVGVVSRPGEESLRPIVRIVYDQGGLPLEEPYEIDTAEHDLPIVEVVDPASLAVSVSEHL